MKPSDSASRRGSRGLRLLLLYLVLLAASHVFRRLNPEQPQLGPQDRSVDVAVFDGDSRMEASTGVVYRESTPAGASDPPTLVLLHGSPGSFQNFNRLAAHLQSRFRLIVPDLPGFGKSSAPVPDYSIRAHANYVLELMDAIECESAHVLGFSLGGGVALNMADIAPERVESIILLASIGVQELELLGDYDLNHILHGLQLWSLWFLEEATPHMGLLDGSMLNTAYARNFFDTDQRPLRELLQSFSGPLSIIHGETDFLVPIEAAREHHRIVPQSELTVFEQGHFILFTHGQELAGYVGDFLSKVEDGEATTRATADPERLQRASEPFDQSSVPPVSGPTLLVLSFLIALATLVSEDLTCIGVGLVVAKGRIAFLPATLACLVGIFVGDMLLYWAGRLVGRPALRRPPLSWMLDAQDLDRVALWFERRGRAAIVLSRFLPGSRLPTYFTAGLARTNFGIFAFYFLLASVIWTPLLVGFAMLFGVEARETFSLFERYSLPGLLLAVVLVFAVVRLGIPLFSHRGRRFLIGRWRRLTRWEFWPPWIFYLPVLGYVLWLALKHRSLSLMTLANPGILAGGFVGESKNDILRALEKDTRHVLRTLLIPAGLEPEERLRRASEFMQSSGLELPIVLKPDIGQRGSGVQVVRDEERLEARLRAVEVDTILQEYAPGIEFGVFYYRHPEEERGHIFSITEKRLPEVIGDGVRNLERLILDDERAVCMARVYMRAQARRLFDVPAKGERIRLVELGTHCRGAVFLDGGWLKSPELEQTIDEVSRGIEGFYFGRYDIRTPSAEDLQRGENFKIIELNGLTSEATHIYDPGTGLWEAYRVLFEQWRIAFEIARVNRERGLRPTGVWKMLSLALGYRELARAHTP